MYLRASAKQCRMLSDSESRFKVDAYALTYCNGIGKDQKESNVYVYLIVTLVRRSG